MSDKKEVIKSILTAALGDGDKEQRVLHFDLPFLKHPLYKKAQDFTNGVYQGFTGGFSDELNGLGKGLVYGGLDRYKGNGDGTFIGGFKRGYHEGRDSSRKDYAASVNSSPYLTTVGEFAGGISNPFLGKDLTKNWRYLNEMDTVYRQTARLLPTAMGYGGLYGVGNSEGQTLSQIAADGAVGAMTAVPFAVAGPVVAHGINQGHIFNGKRLFKKALNEARYKELDFNVPQITYENSPNPLEQMGRIPETMVKRKEPGIYYGRISKDKLQAINLGRQASNLEPITDNRVFISPRGQHHMYERRILDNGKTPDYVVDTLQSALYESPSVAYPGSFDNVKALFKPGEKMAAGVFMGPNNVSGKLGPFSTYEMKMKRFKKLKPYK